MECLQLLARGRDAGQWLHPTPIVIYYHMCIRTSCPRLHAVSQSSSLLHSVWRIGGLFTIIIRKANIAAIVIFNTTPQHTRRTGVCKGLDFSLLTQSYCSTKQQFGSVSINAIYHSTRSCGGSLGPCGTSSGGI